MRWSIMAGLGLAFSIAPAVDAVAQTAFPSKPIRLLVGFPPGGSTDVLARTLANEVRASLGEVLIINKPGATGSLATIEVAGATADGHTVGITPSTTTTLSHVFQNIRPDLLESTSGLLMVGRQRIGMTVGKASPNKTLKDLIATIKREPGKHSIGIPGAGTLVDVVTRAILIKEKAEANIVPMQGDAPIVTALLGGHITAGSLSAGGFAPHVREGSLLLLASMVSDRLDIAPGVPTLLELGYPYSGDTIQYIYGPKGLPEAVARRLTEAFQTASRSQSYVEIARKNALYDSTALSGAALDAHLVKERSTLAGLVNTLGLKRK